MSAAQKINSAGQVLGAGSNSLYTALAQVYNLLGFVDLSNSTGQGGTVRVNANELDVLSGARIRADGEEGGNITLVSYAPSGQVLLQNALVQTNGSTGRGGTIGVAAVNNTLIESSTISSNGYSQGGTIKIGNDAQNGTLPFSAYSALDTKTVISTIGVSSNSLGGYIETSGHALNLLSSINAGRGGMWLIDPTDVLISNGSTINETFSSGIYAPDPTSSTSSVINADQHTAALVSLSLTHI